METSNVPRIPLQLSRQCVVASIQVDLSEEVLRQFRSDLLNLIQSAGARGVILDVSGVDILDLEDFEALKKTMDMAALMGARSIVSGLHAGVVSSLVQLNADTDSVEAALNLDEAFKLIENGPASVAWDDDPSIQLVDLQEDLGDEPNDSFANIL